MAARVSGLPAWPFILDHARQIAGNEKYRRFVSDIAKEMGVFDFQPDQIVWHYTNGAAFLGILQSATLYATQVASLKDIRKTKYRTDLYRKQLKPVSPRPMHGHSHSSHKRQADHETQAHRPKAIGQK
jgi:hypothetical protein